MKSTNTGLKKLTLFVLFVLACTSQSFAQKKNKKNEDQKFKYIVLDYLDDGEQNYKYVENFGDAIGVKIININRKQVTITSDVTSTSFNTEVPAAFKVFEETMLPAAGAADAALGYAANVTADELTLDVSKVRKPHQNDLKIVKEIYASVKKDIKAIDDQTKSFVIYYEHINRVILYHKGLVTLSNICNKSTDTLYRQVVTSTRGLITDDKSDANNILSDDHVQRAFDAGQTELRLILEAYVTAVSKQENTNSIGMKLVYSERNIEAIRNDIADMKARFDKAAAELKKAKSRNAQEDAVLNFDLAEICRALNRELDKRLDYFEAYGFEGLYKNVEVFGESGMQEVLDTYDSFNDTNYTFTIPAETLKDDVTNFKIGITPEAGAKCISNTRSYDVSIRTKGGVKIDFSTGIFGNFGGKYFLDQSYKYEPVNDDTVKIVRNSNGDWFYPTLGALMHVYVRRGTNFQPSLCFGVSTKDLERLNFHAGFSAMIGQEQRFIVSLGVVMGQVTLIADDYEENQQLNKEDAPEKVPTDNFYRAGLFCSLTFNLTKK